MSQDFNLNGKVAIVTGGGRGIGKAIALGLAEAGADVAVASRTLDDLEKVASDIQKLGRKSLAIKADLTVMEDIVNLTAKVKDHFGRIDILVNNSARSFMRSLFDFKEDGWDKIFDTNVKGLFFLSREVAKIMKDQNGGRIINITTAGAEKASPMLGPYHSSKAAVKMLTKCMAVEWAQYGINVNAVGPGLTKTDFSKPIWSNPEVSKRVSVTIPKGRLAEPEEIVGAVVFLASEASNYVTAHSLYVDGGSLA